MQATRIGLMILCGMAAAAAGMSPSTVVAAPAKTTPAPDSTTDDGDESPTPPAGTESSSSPSPATPPSSSPATFEALARGAVPMADLGTLLGPFTGKCDGDVREIDRTRCRTMRAYLRKAIPRRSFWTVVDDPAVVEVSEFDAAIKGYHLSISGCLACTRPVVVGRTQERRLITLKAPDKEAASLRAAVEISRNSVGFDTLAEAKSWFEQSRPELRAQFVFQPADTEWSFGPDRGYAMKLLAMRVFNRCNGEILISRPPSTGIADMPGIEEGCGRHDAKGGGAAPASGATVDSGPSDLSKNDIQAAMNAIRPQVFACFEKFNVPGLAQYEFVVGGNGTVQTVRLTGSFFGTPTGSCLLEAAQNAHFPPFTRARQHFVYPFFLRR